MEPVWITKIGFDHLFKKFLSFIKWELSWEQINVINIIIFLSKTRDFVFLDRPNKSFNLDYTSNELKELY